LPAAGKSLAPPFALPDNRETTPFSRVFAMNIFSKRLAFALIGAAILLTGCPKKPNRPDPSATLLGPGTGGQISPLGLGDMGDTMLEQRTSSRDPNDEANLQRGLLPTVYFDFDKSAIRQSERAKLQEAAAWLSSNPDKAILLEGHCDWRGTAEYNLGLGDRRSQAVKEYLRSIGVDISRLETNSKGDLNAQENATAEQMAQDRRVELVVFR
jgi:peptidoglycan-associated lipoprotein